MIPRRFPQITDNPDWVATRRHAGKKVLHEVSYKGQVLGQRRSDRTYDYVFVRNVGRDELGPVFTVTRWSNSTSYRSGEFGVNVVPFR